MATSPTDVTVLYESKFTTQFDFLTQQMEPRIPQLFRQGNHRGSKGAQAVKQVAKTNISVRSARLSPVVFTDIGHDARWVYPKAVDFADAFDTWDEIQTSADPKSYYVRDALAAFNRDKDLECIRAFDETSKTGETGGSTTAFPAGNIVAVDFGASAATGLTKKKLEEAVRLLIANEVDLDMDQIYCIYGSKQWANLMDEVTYINRDYVPGSPLVTGKLAPFMGCNFVHSEQLGVNGSSYRKVFVFAASGMHFGTWEDVSTKISQRDDLRGNPWQVYMQGYYGATRLQENKVIEVLCSES